MQAAGLAAAVKMNCCNYLLHLVENSKPPTATVDVVCPVGSEITIETGACTVHVGPRFGLKHIVLSNTGAGASRDIDATVQSKELPTRSQKVA